MSVRLFVAVVPPPEVVEDLAEFSEPRQNRQDPLRWADPQRWHLTLAFMRAADEDRYEDLAERLQAAAAKRSAFRLRVCDAGAFPDPIRAKVLWAGIEGETEELSRLAVGARTAVSTAGIAVDGAAFLPHLTLARMNPPVEATRWLRVFDTYRGPEWLVEDIELVESQATGGRSAGRTYRTRDVFTLGGGSPGASRPDAG